MQIDPSTSAAEKDRLAALRGFAAMDTPPEESLDELTRLAAEMCGVPIAYISLIDERRQWFKSRIGLEITETPRSISFCSHTLERNDLLVIRDAREDPRVAGSPLVTGDAGFRFYAGMPLLSGEGAALGTLCVVDRVPRDISDRQRGALRVLSRQVMTHFELRRRTVNLNHSESTLRAIVDGGPFGLFLLDGDGTIYDTNPAWRELMQDRAGANPGDWRIRLTEREEPGTAPITPGGTDPDGAFSRERNFFHFVDEADREEVRAMLGEVITGAKASAQCGVTGHRGRCRWLEVAGLPYEDARSGRRYVLGVTRDITDRVSSENALRALLRENGDLSTALYSHAQVARADTAGRITQVNEKFCAASQYSRAELIGKDHRILNSGHHSSEFFRDLWTTVLAGCVWRGEIKNRAKDGSFFWVETTIVPFLDGEGRICQFLTVRTDITKSKNAEAKVITQNARLGLAVVDRSGCFLFLNDRCRQMLDLPPGELVGQPVAERPGVADSDKILPKLELAFQGSTVSHLLTVCREGKTRHCAVTYEPSTLEGAAPFVIMVVSDSVWRFAGDGTASP